MAQNRVDQAKANKDEFLERVNAEFGGTTEWDEMREAVRSETGGDHVYIHRDVMATKLREGYIVTVHVGRPRFRVQLRPEDLGLNPKNPEHKKFIDKYLSLGAKSLLPADIQDELDRKENAIRNLVRNKYGIPTILGAFVLYENIQPMKDEIEALKASIFQIRDWIYDNFDELREKTEEDYRKFAWANIETLRKAWEDNTSDETIVNEFVKSAMDRFPDRESAERFYVTIDVGVPQTSAFLAEQEARLELVAQRKRQFEEELALIQRQLEEETLVQNERERQLLRLEAERVKTKLAREKQKQKAIEEATAEAKAKFLREMDQVFADISGAVYGILYDTLSRVSEALKQNGALRGADTRSIVSLIEKIRAMSASELSEEVQGWLQQLESIVDTEPQYRNSESVKEVLTEIRAESAKAILAIGRVPRTLRDARIDISDLELALEDIEADRRQSRQVRTGQVSLDVGVADEPTRTPRAASAAPPGWLF